MIDNVLNELYQLNAICVVEQARTHQRVSYLHGKWLVPRTLRSGQRRIYLAGSVRIRISHRRSLWQCRRHGLTLDRYNKELGSVSELSFRKRYELGSFVEEGKTPFKEWILLYCVNPAPLQRFIMDFYEDEVDEIVAPASDVETLNASQIHDKCQVLLRSELFDHHIPLRSRMNAWSGPAGTGETQTTMSPIAETYFVLDNGLDSAISFETLQRLWIYEKTRTAQDRLRFTQ